MSDELDGLRSRLQSTVDVPAFERIAERAEDVRHRRRATRSAVVTGLAAAAIISAVLVVTTLPGHDAQQPSTGDAPAAQPDRLGPKATPLEAGAVYVWSTDRPLRAEIPIKDLDVTGRDRVDLRLIARDDRGGKQARYAATVRRQPSGTWSVVAAEPRGDNVCDDLEVSVQGAVALFLAPGSCSPKQGTRLRWDVTATSDGRSVMKPVEFVTVLADDGTLEWGDRLDAPLGSAKHPPNRSPDD